MNDWRDHVALATLAGFTGYYAGQWHVHRDAPWHALADPTNAIPTLVLSMHVLSLATLLYLAVRYIVGVQKPALRVNVKRPTMSRFELYRSCCGLDHPSRQPFPGILVSIPTVRAREIHYDVGTGLLTLSANCPACFRRLRGRVTI